MNKNSRLVLFILLSLILHSIFIFISMPSDEKMPTPVQTVSVSLKRKAEPSVPPTPPVLETPEPEAAAEPDYDPPVEKQELTKDETISPEVSEPLSETVPAQSVDARIEASDAAEASSEASNDETVPEPSINPFDGLIRRINSLKDSTYPLRAKKRGYQGTVVVELNLDSEGRLLNASIIQKSRHSILNNAALELIEKVFEQPYSHNTGKEVLLRIPISYKLML